METNAAIVPLDASGFHTFHFFILEHAKLSWIMSKIGKNKKEQTTCITDRDDWLCGKQWFQFRKKLIIHES